MPKLIDRLLAEKQNKSIFPHEETYKALELAQFISINDVAQFYFMSSPKSVWKLSDFPNVAPSFDVAFMEFEMPKRMNVNGEIVPSPIDWTGAEFGLLFSGIKHDDNLRNTLNDLANQSGLKLNSTVEEWVVFANVFVYNRGEIIHPCCFYMFVDDHGQILPMSNGGAYLAMFKPDTKWIADMIYATVSCPFFLAMSFMHCKNVTIEQVKPIARVSKRYEKKTGRPLEKYHILNIEPMKKVLRTEGNSEKTGLKQALHICRGHFKDFSQGKGLFGRFKGLYWWDSQVRGSHEQGIVDKDYNVKKPKESKD